MVSEEQPMPGENLEVVKRFGALMAQRDLEAIRDLLCEDVAFRPVNTIWPWG